MSFYPRILYKPGTQWTVDGGTVDLRSVGSEAEESQAIADGWRGTASEALAAVAPVERQPAAAEATPSRTDMITALEAAGVDVDGRWGDKRIATEFAKLKGA